MKHHEPHQQFRAWLLKCGQFIHSVISFLDLCERCTRYTLLTLSILVYTSLLAASTHQVVTAFKAVFCGSVCKWEVQQQQCRGTETWPQLELCGWTKLQALLMLFIHQRLDLNNDESEGSVLNIKTPMPPESNTQRLNVTERKNKHSF